MKRKGLNYIFLIVLPFLLLLVLMLSVDNIYFKMFFYAINYIFLVFTLLRQKKGNLLSIQFLFTAFHVVYIGICPIFLFIYHHMLDKSSVLISTILDNNFFNQQCFLILVSYFAFLLAATLFYKEELVQGTSNELKMNPKNHKNDNTISYSKSIGLIMIFLSFLFEIIYLYKNFRMLFGGNLESSRITAMSGNGVLLFGMWFGTFGLALLYELKMRKKVSTSLFWILCIIHLVSIVLIGFRSRVIVLFLFLVLIHNKYEKLKFNKVIKIGLFLLVLASVLSMARDLFSGGNVNSFLKTIVSSLSNGSINIYYVLRHFPTFTPFQYGYVFLINFLILAPGSQPDFTLWLKKEMGLNFSGGGITPTLLGEAWINFGTWGIILTFFLIGLVCNKLDKWYKQTSNVYFVVLYIWVITSSVRGGIANSLLNLVIYSVMNFILYMMFKKNKVR